MLGIGAVPRPRKSSGMQPYFIAASLVRLLCLQRKTGVNLKALSFAVPSSSRSSEQRFQGYLDLLADALGHADRREPFRLYTTGLLLPGERKSVEPRAACVDPPRVRSRHQSLHHFVADADGSDAAVLAAVRDFVLPA